jgi:hypothetical protein
MGTSWFYHHCRWRGRFIHERISLHMSGDCRRWRGLNCKRRFSWRIRGSLRI